METERTTKPLLQKVAEGMLRAQQEIDELVLQLALGKAEAKDKFEEIKKDFLEKISELKQLLSRVLNKPLPVDLKLKLDELEVRLALGKADSIESFNSQREALIAATVALENEIRKTLEKVELSDFFHHEAEKLLLKLEILRLKFSIKRFEIKDAFRVRMSRAEKTIAKLAHKITKMKPHANLKEEIAIAYKHMKNAVKNL